MEFAGPEQPLVYAPDAPSTMNFVPVFADQNAVRAPLRLLIVADSWGMAQELSFVEPLARLRQSGAAALTGVDEQSLDRVRTEVGGVAAEASIASLFTTLAPDAVIFSRYGGVDHRFITSLAREHGVPVVFHIDEDILEVPIARGAEAYRRYRNSRRLHAFYRIAEAADVVYVATQALADRVAERCMPRTVCVAGICSGAVAPQRSGANPPKRTGELRIGYAGSADDAFDLEFVLEPMQNSAGPASECHAAPARRHRSNRSRQRDGGGQGSARPEHRPILPRLPRAARRIRMGYRDSPPAPGWLQRLQGARQMGRL